ncbi:MAG: glycosyltransferase [Ignavibacteria bacterium]|nr:glycosyltransferase [Ignavibacteria bacterium]
MMEINSPRVTVLMAVKNGMPYLIQAIESILGQSYQNFIFIIINDNSEDDTLSYLNSVTDKRLKIFQIPENGLINALNFGVQKIETEYIAIMDADDICSTTRLEKQIIFLDQNPDYVLVGCSIKYFTGNTNISWSLKLPTENSKILLGLGNGIYSISHPTVMVRTEALISIGGYREEAFPNPDYDLYCRLIKLGKISNLKDEYCFIRLHKTSHTWKNISQITIKNEYDRYLYFEPNKLKLNNFALNIKVLSAKFYKDGLYNYLEGDHLKSYMQIFLSGIFAPRRAIFYLLNKINF